MNLPNHVVLIPDGNRRWAKKRGLPAFFGHREGAKTADKIFKTALELKIPYLTFWGSSLDNITKRDPREVGFLFGVFERWFKKLAKDKIVHENSVKINILGRWKKLFPEKTKKPLREAIEITKNYKNHQLTFLMAYSGIDEMTDTINRIADLKTKNSKLKIDEALIKSNLWTKDLPAADLIIRTGSASEPHNSTGMMMWDIANSQFYFTDTLLPDFSPKEFKKAVEKFGQTERRMGA